MGVNIYGPLLYRNRLPQLVDYFTHYEILKYGLPTSALAAFSVLKQTLYMPINNCYLKGFKRM